MRVVVISLPASNERRTAISSQFADAELDCEFLDGIDGNTAGSALFESIDTDAYLLNTGRGPSNGEIGCFASHKAAWQRCVDINEPIVVLEDDATLLDNFPQALKTAGLLINDFGFIRLQHLRNYAKAPVKEAGGFTLYYCEKYAHGAVGYAISPAAANHLLRNSYSLTAPVDKFLQNFWQHELPLYCLLPESVEPGPLNAASTIAGRDKPGIDVWLGLRRIVHKMWRSVRTKWFNLQHQPPEF